MNPVTTCGAIAGVVACVHDVACPTRATYGTRLAELCVSTRGVAFVIAFGVLRNVFAPLGWVVR